MHFDPEIVEIFAIKQGGTRFIGSPGMYDVQYIHVQLYNMQSHLPVSKIIINNKGAFPYALLFNFLLVGFFSCLHIFSYIFSFTSLLLYFDLQTAI